MISLFVFGRILSHRTAGPIYAFETYLRDLIRGKDRKFKLRKGDDFKHLEELADALRPVFSELSNRQKEIALENLKKVI